MDTQTADISGVEGLYHFQNMNGPVCHSKYSYSYGQKRTQKAGGLPPAWKTLLVQ
jgi:hypothetical protein